MSKHTPPPWRMQRAESDAEAFDIVSDSLPYVATAHGDGQDEGSWTEHNARLITAAPELLEACEWILRQVAPEVGSVGVAKLVAAVTKARGSR